MLLPDERMGALRELRRFTGVVSLGENYVTWRELRHAAAGSDILGASSAKAVAPLLVWIGLKSFV